MFTVSDKSGDDSDSSLENFNKGGLSNKNKFSSKDNDHNANGPPGTALRRKSKLAMGSINISLDRLNGKREEQAEDVRMEPISPELPREPQSALFKSKIKDFNMKINTLKLPADGNSDINMQSEGQCPDDNIKPINSIGLSSNGLSGSAFANSMDKDSKIPEEELSKILLDSPGNNNAP